MQRRVTGTTFLCSVLIVGVAGAQTQVEPHEMAVAGSSIRYLEAGPPGSTTVLLLHGARFTSETWRELGTIATLANAGHHVIALDFEALEDLEQAATLQPENARGRRHAERIQEKDEILHFEQDEIEQRDKGDDQGIPPPGDALRGRQDEQKDQLDE